LWTSSERTIGPVTACEVGEKLWLAAPFVRGRQKGVNVEGFRQAKAYDLSYVIDPEGNQQVQERRVPHDERIEVVHRAVLP